MTPSISIIVPVLNEAAEIVAALAALQAPRAGGAELIVVDGGSGDATVALATPLADRVVAAPRGRASQMNAVSESHARGPRWRRATSATVLAPWRTEATSASPTVP